MPRAVVAGLWDLPSRESSQSHHEILYYYLYLAAEEKQDSARLKNSLEVTHRGVKAAWNLTCQTSKPTSAARQHKPPLRKRTPSARRSRAPTGLAPPRHEPRAGPRDRPQPALLPQFLPVPESPQHPARAERQGRPSAPVSGRASLDQEELRVALVLPMKLFY